MRRTVLAVAVCMATAGCGFVNGEPGPGPAASYLIELGETLPYPESLHSKQFQKEAIDTGRKACAALKRGVSEAELYEVAVFELQAVIPAAINNFCPEEA